MKIPTRLPCAASERVMPAKRHGIAHLVALGALALLVGVAAPAAAHPVPFSYLDIRIEPGAINLTLVVHVFDAAHELGVDPPERLLDPSALRVVHRKVGGGARHYVAGLIDQRGLRCARALVDGQDERFSGWHE